MSHSWLGSIVNASRETLNEGKVIWWLLDAYFVYKYVVEYNHETNGEPLSFNLKTNQSGSDLDQLERLHDLHAKGVLTEDEYQRKRSDIIS
ncbi:SHOCT domain-containing protein [Sphingorhabdus sp.]|uniref:SHOCT domain-containing protein n=1 Tax=Sphingorhabdus sp. TaxID=1902408 RepID=UPI0040547AB4